MTTERTRASTHLALMESAKRELLETAWLAGQADVPSTFCCPVSALVVQSDEHPCSLDYGRCPLEDL